MISEDEMKKRTKREIKVKMISSKRKGKRKIGLRDKRLMKRRRE